MKEANICDLWLRMCEAVSPLKQESFGKCRRMNSEWAKTNIDRVCEESDIRNTDISLQQFLRMLHKDTLFSAII